VEFEPLLLIKELDTLIGIQCKAKGVMLNIALEGELPRVIFGDPLRLKQVLINLMNNSVKFTAANGQVWLRIRAEREAGHQWRLYFQLKDEGVGISPDQIAKLFMPYSQGDKSIARLYGGTGLGLNIAQRIVQSLGGKITVRSELGKGAQFEFDIPVIEALSSTQDECSQVQDRTRRLDTIQSTFDVNNVRLSVLYLDDNEFNLMITQEQLQAKGGRVVTFSEPQKALSYLRSSYSTVDVILSDLQMPEMSGNEFAAAVRQVPELNSIVIIAVTAAELEDLSDERVNHFDAVMNKPVQLNKLQELVGRIQKSSRLVEPLSQ